MNRIVLALGLTLAWPAAGQSPDDLDCDAPQSQLEMNVCAVDALEQADAELNREWNLLRTRLKQAEEDLGYEGWFDKALAGQRGWLAYRDGQCAAEGYGARGGTMEGMLITYCKTRLTLIRVRELKQLDDAGGLGGGFPTAGRLTVEALEAVHGNGTLYRFPQVGGDSNAAARINTYLQTQMLEQIPNPDENPFARVWPEKGSSNGLVNLDYAVSFEHPGIVTAEVFREFYGAYFTSDLDTFHFDAMTGQLITLRDLLTPEAFARLDAEIRDSRLQQIDDFLADKEVNGARLRSDPKEKEEQEFLYQECSASIAAEHAVIDNELRLGRNSYELVREPCGPKAQWALLDLDLDASRFYSTDENSLNEYGHCLLIERRAQCPRIGDGLSPGVYLGRTPDRDPVTLVVEAVDWDGIPTGWYFYTEQRKKVPLTASSDEDGRPVLLEQDSSPAALRIRPKPGGGLTATHLSQARATENPAAIVIAEGRTGIDGPGEPVDDKARWETSPPVLQAIAAARQYWSKKNPGYEENVRVLGAASGAFTQPDVEQHAVLFMMSNQPRCCPPMGLAIIGSGQLVRNVAFDAIAQSVRAIPDIDGDRRHELAFGGSFVGQGLTTQGVRLASFDEEGLDDFAQATIFESACGAGYGDTGALAARLSFVPGTGIIVEHYQQSSCDAETWVATGEPQSLEPLSDQEMTTYSEIPF